MRILLISKPPKYRGRMASTVIFNRASIVSMPFGLLGGLVCAAFYLGGIVTQMFWCFYGMFHQYRILQRTIWPYEDGRLLWQCLYTYVFITHILLHQYWGNISLRIYYNSKTKASEFLEYYSMNHNVFYQIQIFITL